MKLFVLFLGAATLVASLQMPIAAASAKTVTSLLRNAKTITPLLRDARIVAPAPSCGTCVKRCPSALGLLTLFASEENVRSSVWDEHARFFNSSNVAENGAVWYAAGIMLSNLLTGMSL